MGHDLAICAVGLEDNLLKSVNIFLGNTVVSETEAACSGTLVSFCCIV